MEDNNQNKQQKNGLNASVVLSFVVAIFAIVSIAMGGMSLLQNNGVSYAAPTELPPSFTFNNLNGGDRVVGSSTSGGSFNVPMYVADNDATNPVFCVQYHIDPDVDGTYNSGEEINDYGLLYLLNNSYANGVKVTSATGEDSKYVEGWVTQAAIWMYLYETDSTGSQTTSPNYLTADEINAIKNATKLTKYVASGADAIEIYNGANLYTTYVKPLVDKAKSATDVAILSVSKASDEVSLSENKKFYRSALITVTGDPSSSLKNYAISVSGIDGAKAIDEDGNELTTNIPAGTKFYVTIPAEKVTKEIQKVVVTVNGTFTTLEGKYYTAAATGDFQKVVSVKAGEKVISKGTEVEFIGTDDTGMNTFQTIYFIGLIVLLCGVGIVYANAKPVQVKQ